MWTLRDLYHSIPLAERNPRHSHPTLSDHWLKGYPFFYTLVPRASIFKLLATGGYSHADTSRSIRINSPRRVDSNESLPDSGVHLPAEVSAFVSLLISTAMPRLRNIQHSNPLERRIPTPPVPMLSGSSLKGYPYLCT